MSVLQNLLQLKNSLKKVLNKNSLANNSVPRLSLLFLHVPKTAGTSFRHALLKSKTVKTVLCDYPNNRKSTSDIFHKISSDSEQLGLLDELLKETEDYVLTGHFVSSRYRRFFYPYEIGLFFRDPLERGLSSFYHSKRKRRSDLELDEYVETKRVLGLYSRFLGDLPIEYVGFIGISERYKESITLANKLYGLDIKHSVFNVNPSKKKAEKYEISEQIRQKVIESNRVDFNLYDQAVEIFENRKKYALNGKNALYGSYEWRDEKCIIGRAYRAYSECSIHLDIWLDDEKIATASAKEFNPIPCDVKQPRAGCIGFEYNFEQSIKNTDRVRITVKDSEEEIFNFKINN